MKLFIAFSIVIPTIEILYTEISDQTPPKKIFESVALQHFQFFLKLHNLTINLE